MWQKILNLLSILKRYMAVKQQQLFFTLKVEYLPKITIFGLKLMMKRGLEKMLLEFLNGINYFPLLY